MKYPLQLSLWSCGVSESAKCPVCFVMTFIYYTYACTHIKNMQSKDQKACAFSRLVYLGRILGKSHPPPRTEWSMKAFKQNDSKGQEITSQFTHTQNALQEARWLLFFFNLFLAELGLRCSARAFSSCGEWGLLFVAVCGFLTAVASLVAEHGL